MGRSLGLVAAILVGLSPTGGSLAAQKFTLAPQLGFYIPTEDLYTVANGGDPAKLEAGLSFGAALGLWFGQRAGLTVTGSYVPTTFKLDDAGEVQSQDAKLFAGSAQVVLYLIPRTAPLAV
ncbi:MAG: hypothetical protein SGI84_04490, partial [Gemmatimonadota bacterium]|nr:hypothetical protein [Gemmatimonadota bacterium]